MRGDWVDGRLRTNITLFYSDLEDLQTTSATPDGQFLTTNAGGLEVPGIEAEITALPTDNWQILPRWVGRMQSTRTCPAAV